MPPLLKRLLGNGSDDRQVAEDMRAVLNEMRQERQRFETLLESSRGAQEQLSGLSEPIAKAASDMNAATVRLTHMEQRLEAIATLATQIQTLDERTEGLLEGQRRAESQVVEALEGAQQVRSVFEEFGKKMDLATELKGRLETFLEIEKPFGLLRGEADSLRGQVEGTTERLGRLREQHDRIMDAHKLAMSKMEALDRRREELSRDLQDKERRVIGVEQTVRGLDGVRQTVDDVKRAMGSLKTLSDSVAQKTAILEAQRDAVERALAQADNLERAIRQLDTGVQQQQQNEKALGALEDSVAALHSLHENVLERSGEISQLQSHSEEQVSVIRHELAAARDEMKNAVERFEFESKGLESVSQRVADLRGDLSEFENRFKSLAESSQTVRELSSQTQALAPQLRNLRDEAAHIDEEVKKLNGIRRDLEETGRTTRGLVAQVTRIEESKPAVEAVLRDFEQLSSTHAMVKDSLEQTRIAHGEITRMVESQSETRTWLAGVETSLGDLRNQLGGLQDLGPSLEFVQKQTQRITESMSSIEARRDFVEDLQSRLTQLGAVSANLDERGRELQARMEAAEQRFVYLSEHADEAERISKTVAGVSGSVLDATRQTDVIGKALAAFEARCQSVEGLAERTQTLRQELDQRQHSLEEATRNLQKASKLRQEAAASAQQLDELAKQLAGALTSAEARAAGIDEASTKLEDRVANLRLVDVRLGQFEERLSKWELVDQQVSRSLEQIAARQDTVQSLQSDLERMFAMAEKTSADVREITSAHREIAETTTLLNEVRGRLQELHATSNSLDERKRQMNKAEERLARAEGFLEDVQSSLETLQGQKTIVDQAVEKAGSLRLLLRQAEAVIEGLRDERKMTADVHDAVAIVRDDESDDEYGDEGMSKAA